MKPPIQQAQIRARSTQQSYSRGEGYYKNKAIFATIRRGNEIEGRCEGSGYEPYHVSATLDDNGNIEDTSCTCEYDYDGDCKHIVALLLTYLRSPEAFEEAIPMQDNLAERSQEELIALIRQMVAHYPDLKTLIDRPIPRPTTKGQAVDLVPFRRELRQAFNNFNGWGDHSAEEAVLSVADAARAFADAGQWHNASAIYRLILDEFTDQDQYPADDEGELIGALNSVVEAVVECLEHAAFNADEDERRAAIEQLANAYIWDIEIGGFGLGEEELPDAIFRHLRPEDIPALRERTLVAQRRKQQSAYGQWSVETLEHFLMQLDALDNTSPEETLQRLREQGLHRLVFEKLIAMGRVDEAVTVVSKHLTNSYERLSALPLLVSAGRGDEAIRLAQASLRADFDAPMVRWLDQQYQTNGDRNALFELRLQAMNAHPSVGYYAALKEAAEAIEVWARVRPDILSRLGKERNYTILAQLYLYDQEWDAAWETVEHISQQSTLRFGGWDATPAIVLEVAEKSKNARPQKAIPVFVKYARQQIEGRNRQQYSRAAGYLATARDLYQKIGDEDSWNELISGIRTEFRRLPALQDELRQAGL